MLETEFIETAQRYRDAIANIVSYRGLSVESVLKDMDDALENYKTILLNPEGQGEWRRAEKRFEQAAILAKSELGLEPEGS